MVLQLKKPYTLTPEEIEKKLSTSLDGGLQKEEAQKRLQELGPNALREKKKKNLIVLLLEQFASPIVWLLVAAAGLSFFFKDYIEGFAIVAVILVNSFIGFFLEWQAIRSMEALRKMAVTKSRVIRNGKEKLVDSKEIVPGDLLFLEAGDIVPADSRVIQETNLGINESALTGESTLVNKNIKVITGERILAERQNMIFKGCTVGRGNCRAIVTATGVHTQLGKIVDLAQKAEKVETPLEKKLSKLGINLIWLTIFLSSLIFVVGWIRGKGIFMIKTAIALAVAAIPEGLPIVATIALATGMLKLAKRKVIVKKLAAVQSLGETNIICTDKTGTLTENELKVEKILVDDLSISADEFNSTDATGKVSHENLQELINVAVLCNNANFESGKEESYSGDPIEVALLRFATEIGFDINEIKSKYPRIKEIPFDSKIKMMGTSHQHNNKNLVCVKGALEELLENCTSVLFKGKEIPLDDKQSWLDKSDHLASEGLRILAFAFKHSNHTEEDFIQDLTLIGMIGFLDPPREDVRESIKMCKEAGIKVIMVTGDHPQTAKYVANQIELLENGDDAVINGKELVDIKKASQDQIEKLTKLSVFARVSPEQKLDLISLYQDKKFVVGMTGDGVNDAPALRKADIGIAMGIRGTEAAKEVADLVLKDDAFSSIVAAIKQGRIIFGNIREFVIYLLSCNLSEILVVAFATLLNLPSPLFPIQILFLNLVTDVFPALALGFGKGEKYVMKKPPRKPGEAIITKKHWISIITYGAAITVSIVALVAFSTLFLHENATTINNQAFYCLTLSQLWNVFNIPGADESFIRNEVTKNKYIWLALILCILILTIVYFVPTFSMVLSLEKIKTQTVILVLIFSVIPTLIIQTLKRTKLIS